MTYDQLLTLFYVFLALALLSLALTAFLFFRFQIPKIVGLLSGRTQRKEISRLQDQNARSGKLTSGDLLYRKGLSTRDTDPLRSSDDLREKVKALQKEDKAEAKAEPAMKVQDNGFMPTGVLAPKASDETVPLDPAMALANKNREKFRYETGLTSPLEASDPVEKTQEPETNTESQSEEKEAWFVIEDQLRMGSESEPIS